ncbi:MAG: killer suppression protein [Spirochaetaceae bacterium]|nr:MAG: killer suppression protein [Spirochaetaceae bacterium]
MEIVFRSTKLARLFGSREALVAAYGVPQARKIMVRIAVLRAAANLGEVPAIPPDRCHGLSGARDGQYAVDLVHPHRLIFRPYAQDGRTPRAANRASVTSIEILGVEDYH